MHTSHALHLHGHLSADVEERLCSCRRQMKGEFSTRNAQQFIRTHNFIFKNGLHTLPHIFICSQMPLTPDHNVQKQP